VWYGGFGFGEAAGDDLSHVGCRGVVVLSGWDGGDSFGS